ncbi:DUF6232 family protein [Phytohabitans aurantiacus]|uniref:Uncharacterized protein n=1 Tax=Phytohabitans aurantiacus TaxID=3016789 RepID=A0ABQ5R279_9ACTN|nr:DUF6232 family protein [Phytohabitans aurantiacus]GLI00418.1 hypothetical protein Pa4123_56940 [Phytohabitans aurantiacus]
MTVFYRGPCIVITHRDFRILRPHPRVFPIRDLRGVHVVVIDRSGVSITVGSSGMAGVAVVVIATGGLDLPAPLALIGGVALFAVATLAGECFRASARRYELRAVCRSEPVLLFATSDVRTFGQVKRGLIRALQAYDG